MPDVRRHRGPHPQDHERFCEQQIPQLNTAVAHLAWLLTRGYAEPSSLKLVGDRFQLTQRQRMAVRRSACSDQRRTDRQARVVGMAEVREAELWIDGFNVLTTIEAALSGGLLLLGRDGCLRDLASMHGSYRKVRETARALQLIGESLDELAPLRTRWYLDRPVSNSGRLAAVLRTLAEARNWPWNVELVDDPDRILKRATDGIVIASADAGVLDAGIRWVNLARTVVETRIANAWIVTLDGCGAEP